MKKMVADTKKRRGENCDKCDFTGLNPQHRTALYGAVQRLNDNIRTNQQHLIIIGTKNLLRGFLPACRSSAVIIYFTGFGRLYTELALLGALFFTQLLTYTSLPQPKILL